jgi:hypothetical protein
MKSAHAVDEKTSFVGAMTIPHIARSAEDQRRARMRGDIMTTTEQLLGPTARLPHAPGRPQDGARLRLILAVAGLAALVAWGVWSAASTDGRQSGVRDTTDQVAADRAGAARYDGRGKWIGYLP